MTATLRCPTRRAFLRGAGALAFAAALPQASIVNAGGPAKPVDDPLILGQGALRFRANPYWGKLEPARYPVKDCHGIVEDGDGNIVVLTNHTRNNLLVYGKQGNLVRAHETRFPGAHGLDLSSTGGRDQFWITDHERQCLAVVGADGADLLNVGPEALAAKYPDISKYHPTNSAVLPDGDFFVSDGYGSSFVHHFDPKGRYIESFGGAGGGPEHLLTPHSVWIDTRAGTPRLLICDRGHDQLKWFSLSGELLHVVPVPGAAPSNVAPMRGRFSDHIAVAGLTGVILILNGDNRVVSAVGGRAPEHVEGKLQPISIFNYVFQHPHDVYVDSANALYVVQWWSRATYPIKLDLLDG